MKSTAATIRNMSAASASSLHPNVLKGLLRCSWGVLGVIMKRGSTLSM